MPPRKSKRPPSKDDIKANADSAEGKAAKTKEDYDPLNPPGETEELEEMPGGVTMPVRRGAGGRPPKYKPEYARIAGAMLRRGASISELAEVFGVANRTIHLWQQTHDEFMQQFMQLDEALDSRIERSLAERAVGYTYDAIKIMQFQGVPVVVPYKEHVPPDIGAIKLWLSARKRKEWHVKDELEVSTSADNFVQIWQSLGDKKNDAPKQ